MPDRNIPESSSAQISINGAHHGIGLAVAMTKQYAQNEARHPLVVNINPHSTANSDCKWRKHHVSRQRDRAQDTDIWQLSDNLIKR